MSAAPRMFHVTPHTAVAVGRAADSDATHIFLIAASACVVDIELIP